MRGFCIVNGIQEIFIICWYFVKNFLSLKVLYCYEKFKYKVLCFDLYRCKNNFKSVFLMQKEIVLYFK